MTPTLVFDRVWKGYPDWAGSPRTLRAVFTRRAPALARRGRHGRWALRDISVHVSEGQSLGLIGHNGAGKSTFLRLASGLGSATRGRIAIHPDTASVLNLGAAFDDQLTGRENAYTTALVSGLDRSTARRVIPQVLDFAELAGFEHAPVRTYSEGMKLRLAFSTIAVLQPRLLVLDEVLAVGDLAFRTKCMDRIHALQASGTSLVLASHSMQEIAETCRDTLWLQHGTARAYGDTETVIAAYERAVHEQSLAATPVGAASAIEGLEFGENRFGSQELAVASVALAGTLAADPPTIRSGDPLRVAIELQGGERPVPHPIVVVSLHRRGESELLLDLSTESAGVSLGPSVQGGRVEVEIERLDLAAGTYDVSVGVFERTWAHAYDYHYGAYPLRIEGGTAGRARLAPPATWTAGTG